ncbi:hypothetical protein KCU75_g24924, partial [Aureobasidium melanogenum]
SSAHSIAQWSERTPPKFCIFTKPDNRQPLERPTTTDNTNSTLAGTIKIDKMPSEQGHRLYVKGRHLSYQRGKRNTNPNTSLIKIEGVDDSKAA